MIYLLNKNGQCKEFKDHDTKTADALVSSGRWERVTGLKDKTPYQTPKKTTKKKTKKK